jgi:hypothetical protein
MELLQELPMTKPDGTVIPVGNMNVPLSVVSTFKASLLSRCSELEMRITPEMNKGEQMRVSLPIFNVVAIQVYADGADRVVKLIQGDYGKPKIL